MTQDELDALREMPSEFGIKEEVRDGKSVCIPVAPSMLALFHGDDDPMLIADRHGRVWTVGWAEGIRWKRRRREYEA